MAAGDPASFALGDLLSRLRVMAQGRESLDVAQLHFVGLSEIRKVYGDRWPAQKERIQDSAETFLRRRVADSDLLIRGDGGFLVVLGGAAGPDGHAVAAQLTHSLNAFFIGDRSDKHPPRFGGGMQSMAVRDLENTFRGLNEAEKTPAVEENVTTDAIEWKYEPVWDVRREALSYWYVTPFLRSSGVRLPGYQFESASIPPSQLVQFDEANLWVAEQALQDLASAGKPMIIGATINITSMVSLSCRARILATLERLDPALHRFRLIKLAGVVPGFPRMYLNEIMGIMKARLPHVAIGAAWDEPDMAGILQTGPVAVGCSVPASAVGVGSVIGTSTLASRIAEAVRTAHTGRTRLFVEGAVTKYLALKLAAAGVDNIASQRIWPARSEAGGMIAWPASRLVETVSHAGGREDAAMASI